MRYAAQQKKVMFINFVMNSVGLYVCTFVLFFFVDSIVENWSIRKKKYIYNVPGDLTYFGSRWSSLPPSSLIQIIIVKLTDQSTD